MLQTAGLPRVKPSDAISAKLKDGVQSFGENHQNLATALRTTLANGPEDAEPQAELGKAYEYLPQTRGFI